LREAVRTSPSIVITIEKSLSEYDILEKDVGKAIRIELQDSGTASGRFRVTSSVSKTSGSLWISGQSLGFLLPADKIFVTPASCSGSATLLPRSPRLGGTMRCEFQAYFFGTMYADYDISVNALP
jgi:hypothetical protein